MSLARALHQRRSVRQFASRTLSAEVLGQLSWAAQGITHPRGLRTAPSAGARYPLELYVCTAQAVFRYGPEEHVLKRVGDDDRRAKLAAAALGQDAVSDAPVTFVITGVLERVAARYGEERGHRYLLVEVGHAAQNLLLQAAALDLGAVPIGAFHDIQVTDALGLPATHHPYLLVPVGHPASE